MDHAWMHLQSSGLQHRTQQVETLITTIVVVMTDPSVVVKKTSIAVGSVLK